jgi:hypothetical protein
LFDVPEMMPNLLQWCTLALLELNPFCTVVLKLDAASSASTEPTADIPSNVTATPRLM